jgi:predicted nucleic acid-binding protein
MLVVADSSALIALAWAEGLELLDRLFDEVRVNHIDITGSLGVLLLAKQKGLISRITPFLRRLADSEIHLDQALIQRALVLAGETS